MPVSGNPFLPYPTIYVGFDMVDSSVYAMTQPLRKSRIRILL